MTKDNKLTVASKIADLVLSERLYWTDEDTGMQTRCEIKLQKLLDSWIPFASRNARAKYEKQLARWKKINV